MISFFKGKHTTVSCSLHVDWLHHHLLQKEASLATTSLSLAYSSVQLNNAPGTTHISVLFCLLPAAPP